MMRPINKVIGSLIATLFLLMAHPTMAENRYISLSPVMTEYLLALGVEKSLVAVSTVCDYPDAIKTLPRIDGFSPDYEHILALRPTLIVGMANPSHIKRKLQALNLKVHIAEEASSFDDIRDLILALGDVVGKETAARKLAERFSRSLQQPHESQQRDHAHKSGLFLIWSAPYLVAGGDTYLYDYLKAGGLNPVIPKTSPKSLRLSSEDLLVYAPDVIVVSNPKLKTPLQNDPAWQVLSKKGKGRIIDTIPTDVMLRAGPRLPEGIAALRRALYE